MRAGQGPKATPATRALLVLAVVLLASCTLEPAYERPAAPVAAAYPSTPDAHAQGTAAPDTTSPSTPSSPPRAVAAADLGWRDLLHDPRLQRLIELALENNRDLRIAVLNIETARAQYGVARAALFPSIAASGTGARGRGSLGLFEPGSQVKNEFEAEVSVSWELDFFGKVRSLKKAALEQYLATAEARKSAQILLVSEVANQYLTELAADEALRVTDESLRIAGEAYRLTGLQFNTGTGSELDLRESEGALEQARAQRAAQIRARAQAENALVLLVGAPLPGDLPAGLSLDQQAIMADIPAGLPSVLLERRPDIVAAEDLLMAANANIGAARAAFFPSISLTGAAGSVSPFLHQLFQAGTGAWGFQPQASLPLFTGGLNTSNLALARAQREVALAQYEKAIQTAFREVADGLAARSTYEDQVAALNRLVAAERRRLELAQLRYRTGVDSYLVLLTAQTDLNNAELARVTASLDRLTNLVTLYQYLGGGWIEHAGDEPRISTASP